MRKDNTNYKQYKKDISEYLEIRNSDDAEELFPKGEWEGYVDNLAQEHIGNIVENYETLTLELKRAFHFLVSASGYSYMIQDGEKYFADSLKRAVEKRKRNEQ